MDIIRVSARSRSSSVAGAIAGNMRERHYAEVQSIGANAVNQSIKAIAIARGYLREDGIAIACMPVFTEVDIEGLGRTAVRLIVWVVDEASLPDALSAAPLLPID